MLRESDPACTLTPRPLSIRHGASPCPGGLCPVPGGVQLLAALAATANQKPGPWTELLESTLSGGSFCCAGQEASWFPRTALSRLVAGVVQGTDPSEGGIVLAWEEAPTKRQMPRLVLYEHGR